MDKEQCKHGWTVEDEECPECADGSYNEGWEDGVRYMKEQLLEQITKLLTDNYEVRQDLLDEREEQAYKEGNY